MVFFGRREEQKRGWMNTKREGLGPGKKAETVGEGMNRGKGFFWGRMELERGGKRRMKALFFREEGREVFLGEGERRKRGGVRGVFFEWREQ